MINIISNVPIKGKIDGPYKVFTNLVKGLIKISYPYVVNHDLNATKRLWIQNNVDALRYMHSSKAYKVLGPNLFILPRDIPTDILFDNVLYVHPSVWPIRMWEIAGFNSCPILPWPVGIDTDEYRPSSIPFTERCVMVYHKERDLKELPQILNVLHELKLSYNIVLYGRYSEEEYKTLLSRTLFIIWHGCPESQGIAMQEAMSCNIPIIVCEMTRLGQYKPDITPLELRDLPVSVAPYFDESCGIKITDLGSFRTTIEIMLNRLTFFRPRQYILNNLSLERQARVLIKCWEKWGLTVDEGYQEKLLNTKKYCVPRSTRIMQLTSKAWKTLFN